MANYEICPKCRGNGRDNRGDNLVSFENGTKHCFSCGYHVFPKHYVPQLKVPNEHKTLLPADFSREVPAKALQWLLQFGLPWTYWKESIGYSPAEKRLVFPVEYNGNLAFSIGRYFGDEDQSLPAKKKWYVYGDSHRHCHVIGTDGPIVLVEDLISAHKVGQVATAIPLFGVRIHNPHYYYLINSDKPVVLWLDKDQENLLKAKAMNLELIIQRPVKVVTTERDPKLLSLEEINEHCKI